MTQRLYYDNTAVKCTAKVLECREHDGSYDILLDMTVIYPEGGGQLSDTGYIGSASVSYAYEQGHDIWHRCDRALAPGGEYEVSFDAEVRRDHSAQHTGEHILSGLASTMFGCVNVGFHMAEDYVSVDFDIQMSNEDVIRLETAANEAIQRNERTTYRTVSAEELKGIDLRKRAKGLEGDIRIVYCGGVDSCTCCGTHCDQAGEVGLLKILSHANYKGGTRIWFVCGMRAVRSVQEDSRTLDSIARRFSTKRENIMHSVVKQGDELTSLRRELKTRTDALFEYTANGIYESAPRAGKTAVAICCHDGYTMQELGVLCECICKKGSAIAVAFSLNEAQTVYRMARTGDVKLSMKELCSAVNAITGGKGGGRDDSAQGSAGARSDIREICAQLEAYTLKRISGK